MGILHGESRTDHARVTGLLECSLQFSRYNIRRTLGEQERHVTIKNRVSEFHGMEDPFTLTEVMPWFR
jgi:hypothetical protein